MKAMGKGFDKTYQPDQAKTDLYQRRYQRYKDLGAFIAGKSK
jgi:L-ribulokinase